MLFINQISNSQLDDIGAKVIVNYIFGNQCSLEFIIFMERLKHQFENINKIIKDYFQSKFIDKNIRIKLPILSKPSYILNQQLVSILYLSNPVFSNFDKLNLIYSNCDSNLNFDKMASSLLSKKTKKKFFTF